MSLTYLNIWAEKNDVSQCEQYRYLELFFNEISKDLFLYDIGLFIYWQTQIKDHSKIDLNSLVNLKVIWSISQKII